MLDYILMSFIKFLIDHFELYEKNMLIENVENSGSAKHESLIEPNFLRAKRELAVFF